MHPAWPWVAVAGLLALPALALGWVDWPDARAGAWGVDAAAPWAAEGPVLPLAAQLLWQRSATGLHAAWQLITAAWVHGSALHLAANLAGTVVVALLGMTLLREPPAARQAALAWLLAWPLTHAGLWLDERLLFYAGASGVLHAGVAVLGWAALVQGSTGRATPVQAGAHSAALVLGSAGVAASLKAGSGSTAPVQAGCADASPAPARPALQLRLIGGLLLAGLAAKVIAEAPWSHAMLHHPGWDLPIAPLAHATGAVAGLACAVLCLRGRRGSARQG